MKRSFLREIYRQYETGGLRTLIQTSFDYIILKGLALLDAKDITNKYYRLCSSKDICDYKHSPNPFKIARTNPEKIVNRTGRRHPILNRRRQFGSVKSGDWDQYVEDFDSSIFFESWREHFKNGVSWDETQHYKNIINRYENGDDVSFWFESVEQINEEFEKYDNLYANIRDDGYQSQKELKSRSDGLYPYYLNEVAVDVARDGELLLADGMHRLAIAKLLDIDHIPIVFLVRHEKWMIRRERILESNDNIEHPDLLDIGQH